MNLSGSHGRSRAALVAALVAVVGLSACSDKAKQAAAEQQARVAAASQVSGLAAIPAGAHAVLGADVAQLAASPLVRHALRGVVERDPGLGERLAALQTRCKLDLAKDLTHVHVALMGDSSARDVLLVAEGRFDEAAIVACVRAQLEADGGSVTPSAQGGMTVYLVKNPTASDVALGFGAAGTLVVADSEALVRRALDPAGAKLPGDAAAMARIARADTRAAIWGAGVLEPAVGQGLMTAASGAIGAPGQAIWGHLAPSGGLRVELGVLMASAADAKALAALAQKQVAGYAVVAQGYGLGPAVRRVVCEAHGDVFTVRLDLGAEDLAKLETLLDGPPSQSTDPDPKEGKEP